MTNITGRVLAQDGITGRVLAQDGIAGRVLAQDGMTNITDRVLASVANRVDTVSSVSDAAIL